MTTNNEDLMRIKNINSSDDLIQGVPVRYSIKNSECWVCHTCGVFIDPGFKSEHTMFHNNVVTTTVEERINGNK